MNNRILLLLSDLRGIDDLVKHFQTIFPTYVFIPILFSDECTSSKSEEWLHVHKTNLKNFTRNFDFSDVTAIYVSFMTGEKMYFSKRAPLNVKLIWSIPGGDLYNRYLRYFGYPIVYGENRRPKYIIGKLLRRLPRRREFNYLIRRCSAIVSANCDYSLIKKYSPKVESLPKHIYSIAYPMEKMLGDLYGKPFVKNLSHHVIIGNSASRTNNHLYVLKCLRGIDTKESSISLLMSYGGSDDTYKEDVFSKYRSTFGDSVSFITDYMPLSDFNRMLTTATHFVYGNWRQEAVGNILTAFYLGGKVYLSNLNPLLQDFRSKGFCVFCLEEADDNFFSPMTIEEKEHNRHLIDDLYNVKRCGSLLKDGLMPILTTNE